MLYGCRCQVDSSNPEEVASLGTESLSMGGLWRITALAIHQTRISGGMVGASTAPANYAVLRLNSEWWEQWSSVNIRQRWDGKQLMETRDSKWEDERESEWWNRKRTAHCKLIVRQSCALGLIFTVFMRLQRSRGNLHGTQLWRPGRDLYSI